MASPSPPALLLSALRGINSNRHSDKDDVFVTLTFAQSLDAKIAGVGGQQLILSGKESMIMTHWMRTMHDAIMVGIGTAISDDPQLNIRHLISLPDGKNYPLPQPVIVDTSLRLPTTCKLLKNYAAGTGKQPWLVARRPSGSSGSLHVWSARKSALEHAGARIVLVEGDDSERYIAAHSLVSALQREGIRSLMVEGGARVIQSFFARPELVQRIIVTVVPVFVGQGGVSYNIQTQMPPTKVEATEMFGRDVVTALSFTASG